MSFTLKIRQFTGSLAALYTFFSACAVLGSSPTRPTLSCDNILDSLPEQKRGLIAESIIDQILSESPNPEALNAIVRELARVHKLGNPHTESFSYITRVLDYRKISEDTWLKAAELTKALVEDVAIFTTGGSLAEIINLLADHPVRPGGEKVRVLLDLMENFLVRNAVSSGTTTPSLEADAHFADRMRQLALDPYVATTVAVDAYAAYLERRSATAEAAVSLFDSIQRRKDFFSNPRLIKELATAFRYSTDLANDAELSRYLSLIKHLPDQIKAILESFSRDLRLRTVQNPKATTEMITILASVETDHELYKTILRQKLADPDTVLFALWNVANVGPLRPVQLLSLLAESLKHHPRIQVVTLNYVLASFNKLTADAQMTATPAIRDALIAITHGILKRPDVNEATISVLLSIWKHQPWTSSETIATLTAIVAHRQFPVELSEEIGRQVLALDTDVDTGPLIKKLEATYVAKKNHSLLKILFGPLHGSLDFENLGD